MCRSERNTGLSCTKSSEAPARTSNCSCCGPDSSFWGIWGNSSFITEVPSAAGRETQPCPKRSSSCGGCPLPCGVTSSLLAAGETLGMCWNPCGATKIPHISGTSYLGPSLFAPALCYRSLPFLEDLGQGSTY